MTEDSKNILKKAVSYISGMSKGVKIILSGIIITLIIISSTVTKYNNQFTMVPLYTTDISTEDIDEIRLELTKKGYNEGEQFTVIQKEKSSEIQVQEILRGKVLIQLANSGLPHNFSKDIKTDFTQTEYEIQMSNIKNLENELAKTITLMDGINKACVKIVPEEEGLFENSSKPGKGTVMLQVSPDYTINKGQILGIVNLVSGSVKGLSPEQVVVVDHRGVDLSGLVNPSKDFQNPVPSDKAALQMDLEKNITERVQKLLDWGLGKENAYVEVRLTLNFDQCEKVMKVLGKPGGGENKITKQTGEDNYIVIGGRAVRPAGGTDEAAVENGGHVISYTIDSEDYKNGKGNGNFYKNEKKAFNIDYDKFDTHIIKSPGSIDRISVALMLNNQPAERVNELKNLVSAAVGIDEGRGDTIEVSNFPFARDDINNMNSNMVGQNNMAPKSGSSSYTLFYLLTGVLFIGFSLVFILKLNKSNREKSKLCLQPKSISGFFPIADHNGDKTGNTVSPAQRNTSQTQLTMMAKQNPGEIAQLLKTSWLAS